MQGIILRQPRGLSKLEFTMEMQITMCKSTRHQFWTSDCWLKIKQILRLILFLPLCGQLSGGLQAQVPVEPKLGYIGMQLSSTDLLPRKFQVSHLALESPAAKSGLRLGDVLVAVNGSPLSGNEEASDVISKIRGPFGSKVQLTITRGDDSKAVTFSISRDLTAAAAVVEPAPTKSGRPLNPMREKLLKRGLRVKGVDTSGTGLASACSLAKSASSNNVVVLILGGEDSLIKTSAEGILALQARGFLNTAIFLGDGDSDYTNSVHIYSKGGHYMRVEVEMSEPHRTSLEDAIVRTHFEDFQSTFPKSEFNKPVATITSSIDRSKADPTAKLRHKLLERGIRLPGFDFIGEGKAFACGVAQWASEKDLVVLVLGGTEPLIKAVADGIVSSREKGILNTAIVLGDGDKHYTNSVHIYSKGGHYLRVVDSSPESFRAATESGIIRAHLEDHPKAAQRNGSLGKSTMTTSVDARLSSDPMFVEKYTAHLEKEKEKLQGELKTLRVEQAELATEMTKLRGTMATIDKYRETIEAIEAPTFLSS